MISDNVLPFLPQRYPFIMIDTLLYVDDAIARTAFTIPKENIFSEAGVFTEAGLLENIAQTAAAGAGYKAVEKNLPVKIGYITTVKNFEVFFLPEVGSKLTTEIIITGHLLNMMLISGNVILNDLPVACCEMRVFIETGN